jgi:hypothetical protein
MWSGPIRSHCPLRYPLPSAHATACFGDLPFPQPVAPSGASTPAKAARQGEVILLGRHAFRCVPGVAAAVPVVDLPHYGEFLLVPGPRRAEFATPPLQQVGGEERFAKPRLIVPPSLDRQAVLEEGLDLVVRAAGPGHAAAQGVECGGNQGRRSVRTGLSAWTRSPPEDAETLGCHVRHRSQLLSALRECRWIVW